MIQVYWCWVIFLNRCQMMKMLVANRLPHRQQSTIRYWKRIYSWNQSELRCFWIKLTLFSSTASQPTSKPVPAKKETSFWDKWFTSDDSTQHGAKSEISIYVPWYVSDSNVLDASQNPLSSSAVELPTLIKSTSKYHHVAASNGGRMHSIATHIIPL